MSILELGALGEFVSSLAIVVALAGIFYQVRQSNASQQNEFHAAALGAFTPLRLAVLSDREVAELFVRATTGPDSLDEADSLRLTQLFAHNLWTNYVLWTRSQRAEIREFDVEYWERSLRAHMSPVLARRFWSQEGFRFPNGPFRAMVDRIVAELEAEGPVVQTSD